MPNDLIREVIDHDDDDCDDNGNDIDRAVPCVGIVRRNVRPN
jgi:hypothetical protein